MGVHTAGNRPVLAAALSIMLALLMLGTAKARAETFVFEKNSTNVTFSWNHLGLSRQSGRFVDVSGTLDFDTAAPEASRLTVSIGTASVWTGVPSLDKLLRSSDYFDASRHPTITFRSTSVRRTGENTGEVSGDLTILGETKPVTMQVTMNYLGEHPLGNVNFDYKGRMAAGFSAQALIRRSDWGISRGVPLVSDDIYITIEAELVRQ
jgi:polyisoprenoid-binding protein YceI